MKKLFGLIKSVNKIRDFALHKYIQHQDSMVRGRFYYVLTILLNELRWICELKVILPIKGGEFVKVNLLTLETFYLPFVWEGNQGTRFHKAKLKDIYTLKDFVVPEKGDVMIDVGAYVGTFSVMYASTASKIFAVDPNAIVSTSLTRNAQRFKNIHVVPRGLWNKNEKKEFNLSWTPNDNSLLPPDKNSMSKSIEIDCIRLDHLALELGLQKIDFLKVEAEGVEPEILEGMGDLLVHKISVNCGPERYGESPTKEVVEILEQKGYSCIVKPNLHWRGEMVYARKT